MKAIFPGKPQAKLQAVSTVLWDQRRIVTYISGSILLVLRGPNDLVQSISHGDEDDLEAVSIGEASGKIATCTKSKIFIYKPYGVEEGALKWSLQHTLHTECGDSSLCALSWGQPNEILVGGSSLTLLDTDAKPREIWTRKLANPVKLAAFTPDASFIASTGWHDTLVKVWQRSFLGANEERFDVSYLPHPSTVTGIRWHRRPNQDYHSDTVLYTTCDDNNIRIWSATDHHGLQALQLWTTFNLTDAIIPASPQLQSTNPTRCVFIMDGWEFETTVEHAMQRGGGTDRQAHTREHLMDVAYRNPDVCVVMDDNGNMSAWGLERVGCKARQPNDVFNIAIVENMSMDWPNKEPASQDLVCLYDFGGPDDGTINVLAHSFDGSVRWLKAPVDQLFDSAPSSSRFTVEAIWTGHSDGLAETLTSSSLVLSRTYDNHFVAWSQDRHSRTTLSRNGEFEAQGTMSSSCLLPKSCCALVLHNSTMTVWALAPSVTEQFSAGLDTDRYEKLCPMLTFDDNHNEDAVSIVCIGSEASCLLKVDFDHSDIKLVGELKRDQPSSGDIIRLSGAYDPACLAFSLSTDGNLAFWSLDVMRMVLRRTIVLRTRIMRPSLLTMGMNGDFAMTNTSNTCLSIWSLSHAQLEYEETFAEHDTIQHIEIQSTKEGHSVLAVAFSHKVYIYLQQPYTYSIGAMAWVRAKTVDLGEVTSLNICTCSWLSNHDLLLGAGNQMFVFDDKIDMPPQTRTALNFPGRTVLQMSTEVATMALHSSHPSMHPEILSQQIIACKISDVDLVLRAVFEKMKYWTPGEDFSSCIGTPLDQQPQLNGISTQPYTNGYEDGDHDGRLASFTEDIATSLVKSLHQYALPFLSKEDQNGLARIANSIGALERHRKALDEQATVYQAQLRLLHEVPSMSASTTGWRNIAWALHSATQDVLVDLSSRLYQGKMLWTDARQCGLFMWLTDNAALRTQFEVIARNEYTKTDEKNPVDCTLFYLALRKKQVLVGLWRMATWNKEQRGTQKMLANNFADPRWQTAAMKNAYALLGLRRFEYAAAFFLLADKPKDAVNILASQINDLQLAIAVARIYEGDNGPVLKELLTEKVLPEAAHTGNRWLATWAFWTLGEKHKALRALLEPLEDLIHMSAPAPPPQVKHYRNNEPSLVHYYIMLRTKIQKTPGDKTELLSPKAEHDLVMRSAMCYVRAGCDSLALDLVRNWRYTERQKQQPVNSAAIAVPEKVAAFDDEAEGEEEFPTPAPTTLDAPIQRKKVYAEPSAASIMDNFNF